jgi:NAD-reducing hydrogenase large subunit
LVVTGERRGEGIGVIEAPRGNLIHHYEVDENDQVTYCNLIVSTTHNNEGMNRAVKDVAVKHFPVMTRSPKACSTMSRWRSAPMIHASPAPPMRWARCRLQVELFNADGELVDSKAQSV